MLRSSASALLQRASPPFPSVSAEPSACALYGVRTGRSVAPGLRRKDTLVVRQNIRASCVWPLVLLLFSPALPPTVLRKPPSSIHPLRACPSGLWLQGKDAVCVSTKSSMLGLCWGPFSYLGSPFSERCAGPVSIWGLISPKYRISFSAWRMLSTLLFICPPPTPPSLFPPNLWSLKRLKMLLRPGIILRRQLLMS